MIKWVRGGTCVLIRDEVLFTEQILMHDFKCLIYQSFRRQLNTYGFSRVLDDEYRSQLCYMHPWFQKDMPDQLYRIERKQQRNRHRGTDRYNNFDQT